MVTHAGLGLHSRSHLHRDLAGLPEEHELGFVREGQSSQLSCAWDIVQT